MKKLKIYLITILSLLIIIFVINFVTGYFSNRVSVYVKNKATIFTTQILRDAVQEEVVNKIDVDKLIYLHKNNEEVVKSVYINTQQVNSILSGVNTSLLKGMNKLENETLTLPLGIIISETLFYNLGPDLKIRIMPVGSVETDIISKVSAYGINSSLLEIAISVKVQIDTIIPLKKGSSTIDFNIPIVIQILNSDVPRYYYNTNDVLPFINYD